MECKNCQTQLIGQANYCDACGARVVHERFTLRRLWNEVVDNLFGWDNAFFKTYRDLFWQPQTVLNAYVLQGVRKRYVNPFGFYAIGVAITVLLLTIFQEEYMNIADQGSEAFQTTPDSEESFDQKAFQHEWNTFVLKYQNFVAFSFLPLYALLSFLLFRKKGHNYAEHLLFNAYIQGWATFISIGLMIIGVVTSNGNLFMASMLPQFLYNVYAWKEMYSLSWGQLVLKTLLFLVLLTLMFGIFVVAGVAIIFLVKSLT